MSTSSQSANSSTNLAIPAPFASFAAADAASTGWIRITGGDRVRWLNGMVTNSVQALKPGDGAYTFLLNAQGRIQGDGIVWAAEDHLFLETGGSQTARLKELLDHFIIMDDVELSDSSASLFGIRIAGPQSAEALQQLGLLMPQKPYQWTTGKWMDHTVFVVSTHSPVVPRFELWVEAQQTARDLLGALHARGAAQATDEDFEKLRVVEATPRYGVDIRDRDLPQETEQTRALHFNKGCYLGQEIVERIRSRGNVHRTFQAFTLAHSGPLPEPGTPLEAEGKQVGELTSVALLPDGTHGLGYIRREVLERKLPITFAGGTAQPISSPS